MKASKPRKRIVREQVKIPEGGIKYKVQKGDSLWKIAVKYNLKTSTLAAANNIDSRKPLRVGQELLIPGAKAATAAPAPAAAPTPSVEDMVPVLKEDKPEPKATEDKKPLDLLESNESTDDLLDSLPADNTKDVNSVDDLLGPAPAKKKAGESVEIEDDITLDAFCAKYGVNPEDVKKLNPGLPKSGKLTSGMFIALP
jgi:LysM repeat protein